MLRANFISAVLLALSFLFNRAQGIEWFWQEDKVIGYAMVTPGQAARINQNNKLYVEKHATVELQEGTGDGFYMLDKPGWRTGDGLGMWFCAIKANKKAISGHNKVWVPRSYEKKSLRGEITVHPLWNQDEKTIVNYIRSKVTLWQPDEALRFSWIYNIRWQRQMAIPTQVVKFGGLGLWAQCFDSEKKLKNFANHEVQWEKDWKITSEKVWSSHQ
ncbi:hypothetical protein LZ554_008338 [Drepanopeziza brunnea f. sp. 'monogermtubi']|nr:hypothetical protein LZ554_008338 [Drepanopeziza brunnea f. sp. 'monogermtubi']